MLTRRALLRLPVLSCFLPVAWPASGTTRRALVVGINQYEPPGQSPDAEVPEAGAHATATPSAKRGGFRNLDGAVNDATLFDQLLKDQFAFLPSNILFLKDRDANRSRILQEFQRHLIDAAAPGDVSLFYYAGHGSQVQNLASDEADQLDETIVPADASTGARDIRDKEMARLYRAAAQKGVLLTVVLDSCHSGGMSRGLWNQSGKTRYVPPDPRPVTDADRDPVTGKKPPDAASMGVLFLMAAREDQPSRETVIIERGANGATKEVPHGAFTAALARVLRSPIANQSIEQICERVQAMLTSEGQVQVPICAGKDRASRGLLGQPAGLGASITVPVLDTPSEGLVRLRGGSALGLAAGCTLIRIGDQPVRLELTRVDLAISEAKLLGRVPARGVQAGDLFKLDTWVAPPNAAIKLYFPKAGPEADAVLAVARAINQLTKRNDIEVLSELSPGKTPTHVLYWAEGGYYLERHPSDGNVIRLGLSPAAGDLAKALEGASPIRLWPNLPPDRRLASEIRLGAGTENLAVQLVNRPADCVYFLAGRLNRGVVEYAWLFKDAFVVDRDHARLPLCTDWKTSGEQVTGLAVRLARIYGWLNLDSPAGGEEAFPYRLVLQKAGSQQPAGAGPFRFGEEYKFVFQAAPEALKEAEEKGGVAKRYVYVFVIDSAGEAKCFFPDPAFGNEGNLIPRGENPVPRIEATREKYDLQISEPEGTDNYFMVASRDPLDPGIFQWTGVREAVAARRGAGNPLEFLFNSVGEGKRGAQGGRSVPVTWSIQSMAIRSVP